MTLDPVGATGTSDALHSELSGGTRQVKVFTMQNLHDGPSAGSSSVGRASAVLIGPTQGLLAGDLLLEGYQWAFLACPAPAISACDGR
jgi:hypothetical protein